jgi:hypothetical protein
MARMKRKGQARTRRKSRAAKSSSVRTSRRRKTSGRKTSGRKTSGRKKGGRKSRRRKKGGGVGFTLSGAMSRAKNVMGAVGHTHTFRECDYPGCTAKNPTI